MLAFVLMLIIVLAACGASTNEGNENSSNGNNDSESNEGSASLGDKEITLPYVAWAGCIASTHVVKAVLEDVGYEVSAKQVGKGPMYSSVADGSADAHTCTWLPNNGLNLWDKYHDSLEKVNKTINVAPMGLTVPAYMDIKSIKDLKNNTKLGEATDWTITGIEPGNGEMILTKKLMKEYGLDKWTLQSSSGPVMSAALGKAIEDKEPIIVTLWKPHWAFGEWDLRILKNPKNIYGDPDSIYTVVRKGLKEDSPAAYKILSQFDWTDEQMGEVMVSISKDTEPSKAGKQFVKNHQDLVKKWTKGVQ